MAYRFNGSSDHVRFAIGPFGGITLSALTIAIFLKRNSISDDYMTVFTDSGLTVVKASTDFAGTSFELITNASANSTRNNALAVNSTTPWYLLAVTWPGSGAARFHRHDGTSWTHSAANSGTAANTTIGGTDRLYISGPPGWGVALHTDVVCAGIKKADSSDATIETLSRTAFSAWTGFSFDWLIGFDSSFVSGGLLQDQASPGTGDELSRSGTSLVSDPPGWAFATAVTPAANFTGTPLSGTEPLSVAFTDSSTNSPTSWAWTFGDGGTSTSQNPTHSYAAAGTYTVALVATNSAGSNTLTRSGYVTVSDQPRPIRINTSQGWADIGGATSFVSGAGAPTVAVGATGAIYLDTTSHRVYGPKAAGAWPSTPLGVLVPDYTGVTNGWSLKIVSGVPAWSA